jgi:hypothetical protein
MAFKDFIKGLRAKIDKKKNDTYVSGERYSQDSNIELIPNPNTAMLYQTRSIVAPNNYYNIQDGDQTIRGNNNSDNQISEEDIRLNIESIYKRNMNRLDERIEKKPVDVYQELFEETPKIDLVGIKERIKLVEKRLEYMKFLGGQTGDEKIALRYLYARSKFEKYGNLFTWSITTKNKIDALCKKYTLANVSFHAYSKTIPMEAIYEIEKYIKAWNKVTKKGDANLTMYLIIEDTPESSQSGERKKDPILYADSPFGKWFYILGAWDKEVQYVDEIVYRGK